jgi:uncharacterized protein
MRPIPRLMRIALAIALAGAAALSSAQGTVTPAKKELVQKTLRLSQANIEGVGAVIAGQTAAQALQAVRQAMARVPQDKRQALANELQADIRRFQEEATPLLRASAVKSAPSTLGAMLEEKFSEDELKVLNAWLESPVSRKYQQLSSDALQALSQKIIAETRPQIEPKLKTLDQQMTAKLNAAIANAPDSRSSSQPAPK